MGKNKKKTKVKSNKTKSLIRASSALQQTSRAVNKKGKLKGRNKQDTKRLKAICPHNRITKKNDIVETYRITEGKDGQPWCICTQCGAKFLAGYYETKEMKAIIKETKMVIENAKFLATAVNGEPKVIDKLASINSELDWVIKTSKKLTNIAKYQDDIKKNKKKNKNKGYGGGSLGHWGSTRR